MAVEIPPWLTRDIDPVGSFQRSQQIVNQDQQAEEELKQRAFEANQRAAIAFAEMAQQERVAQAVQRIREQAHKDEVSGEAARLRFAQEDSKRRSDDAAKRLIAEREFRAPHFDPSTLGATKDLKNAAGQSIATGFISGPNAMTVFRPQAEPASKVSKEDQMQKERRKHEIERLEAKEKRLLDTGPSSYNYQSSPEAAQLKWQRDYKATKEQLDNFYGPKEEPVATQTAAVAAPAAQASGRQPTARELKVVAAANEIERKFPNLPRETIMQLAQDMVPR